uniref:Integrin, alpha 6b n=1 Tax=Amphilophus citrinellus TaxID=61819 RepID=A0A3Q0SIX9_AMPCI
PLFLHYLCGRLSAFNLDTENVLQKTGDPGSLFGFSLAMHRQLTPVDKRLLLVGAPRANALKGQKSKVTGGLYNCDMSSTSNHCTRVVFDNDEDTGKESKENQWMGVTVKSQGPGGQIVVCAHRYQRRDNVGKELETRDIIGRCYVLSQKLTIDPTQPDGEGGSWLFCDQRSRGHEMFGTCQQGLSATFDKDYHYLIFGAPGAYNWKGIVRMEQKNDSFIDMGIFVDGPYEVGDENERNPDLIPAPPSSYLGFSLDSGKSLTMKGQLTVVAGAPRANHSGAVVLLKKGGAKKKILLEEYILEGEGLSSSFGYDLTVLDLNKDGWEDIVVGAPQYFEKDGEIGGAVYVYINKAGKWNNVKPTRIDGPQDSMFGLAVENLGDINQDGYDDFAVGAPYEDKGMGKVYIYYGSATGQISAKASQVLSAPSGVKLFGYSLAGNMDLDYNSYPDLAVGSLSDAVFVYRSRPVIDIKKEITILPEEIDLTKRNCGNKFWYCGLHVMFCGAVVLQDTIRDKLRGIPIDVSVEIIGGKRKRRQSSSPELQPVLDAKGSKPARSVVQFMKEGCGSDKMCQSNLQMKYRYGHWDQTHNVNQKEIALEVSVTNPGGDDAYEASVNASFPRSLTYSATRPQSKVSFNCQANKDGSQVSCELGNPFKRDSEATFYIILGTSGISLNNSELEVNLQLDTTSKQQIAPVKAKIKVAVVLQLSVSGQVQPSQVYFTGAIVGEAAMKSESEIGSAITHNFRIINLGRRLTDFGTATLEIDWPKETVEGKWLLYLMNISTKGVDQIECTPKSEINPLNIVSKNIMRAASNAKGSDEGTISRLIENKKSETLDCQNGANCVKIRCPLRGLDSNAAISLHSRLWNSTFLEVTGFTQLSSLDLRSGHISKMFPERREARHGGVPWWIIVLSILFGLLLLALLAFLLWKVRLEENRLS